MSAWAELVNVNGSDEWLELCNRALEEVQRETSRRNAAKIRTFVGPRKYDGEPEHITRYVAGWHDAAGLIDPEVS